MCAKTSAFNSATISVLQPHKRLYACDDTDKTDRVSVTTNSLFNSLIIGSEVSCELKGRDKVASGRSRGASILLTKNAAYLEVFNAELESDRRRCNVVSGLAPKTLVDQSRIDAALEEMSEDIARAVLWGTHLAGWPSRNRSGLGRC